MSTIQRRAFVLALLILVGPGTGPALPAEDQPPAQQARVYKANRGQIRNPNLICPGQVFVLPTQ